MGTKPRAVDALDLIGFHNDAVDRLTHQWRQAERQLAERSGSDARWDRDAAIRLLLVHMREREAARAAVTARLRDAGNSRLADLFAGGAPNRRLAIHQLAEELHRRSIDSDPRGLIDAAEHVVELWRSEVGRERNHLVPAAEEVLGPSGRRGLPSAAAIHASTTSHVNPTRGWRHRFASIRDAHRSRHHVALDALDVQVAELNDHQPRPR